MIKAEIRTDIGNYDLKLGDAKTLQDAWELVEDTLKAGMPFVGDGYLVIGQGASIKHIRIYEEAEEATPPVIEEQDDVEPAGPTGPTGPHIFITSRCTFLGQQVQVKGQAIEKDGHTWYLPMELNHEPALEMLGPEKLEEFLVFWNMSKRVTDGSFTVVIPPSQLPDYEEALAYLQDYIAETAPAYEPKEKNAKAWPGWKE